MTTAEQFDFFTNDLLDNAIYEFKSTEQHALLKEKLDKMNSDCENMLTEDERDFANECFDLIYDVSSQQEAYVYHKGLRDCVVILKELGVLA